MIRRWLEHRRYMREHHWSHARLSEYLDGELGEEERRRFDAHTSICPQCTRVLATLRRTLDRLRGLRSPGPAGLADGVVERLRDEPAS